MSALLRLNDRPRVLADAGEASAMAAFEDTQRLADALHHWNVASETVYLGVGEEIQGLHRKVAQVRDGIGRSTQILATEEMTEMRHGLKAAAENSRGVAALSQERSEALGRLRAAVNTAATGSAAVLLVFRLLDYIVLIARTQVQGMAEGQDELVPFTAHVDELVALGETVARGIDGRTHLLERFLAETRSIELRAHLDGPGLIDDFMALAARIEAQQHSAAERREEAHAAFTAAAKAIGGIVSGLQFHDNARQRLEHTITNLGRMRNLQATGMIGEGLEPIAEALRPAAMRRIACLEIAQLDDLAGVYQTKMAELDDNLARIGQEIDRSEAILDRLIQGMVEGGAGPSLDTEADRLRTLFKAGDEARHRLGENLNQCVEATGSLIEMTGQLDTLEYDLKIAGLNAAVRAAHVTSGDTTIGYIARVICEQASIARTEADRIRQGIERAVEETRDLAARILPTISAGEGAIENRLTETTDLLSQVEQSYALELRTATGVAASLGEDVGRTRAMMTPHIHGCDLMRSLGAALAAIVAEMPETEVSAQEMAGLDALLAGQYSMAEERAIFAAVVGAGAAPFPAATLVETGPAPGSDEDLDDILF